MAAALTAAAALIGQPIIPRIIAGIPSRTKPLTSPACARMAWVSHGSFEVSVTTTLLIVGGADPVVLELNRGAAERLTCRSELAVVPGATHIFEEQGTLERVASLAAAWFTAEFEAAASTHQA